MIAWTGRPTSPGEERVRTAATLTEGVVLAALLVFLGIAAGKLFLMLGSLGVPLWKGLPVGALFVGAAFLTARRLSACARNLRRGRGDDAR
ncbi:hypothetical protein K8I85_07010 [bacterium]|nr:hypothetical protein [bacterium]